MFFPPKLQSFFFHISVHSALRRGGDKLGPYLGLSIGENASSHICQMESRMGQLRLMLLLTAYCAAYILCISSYYRHIEANIQKVVHIYSKLELNLGAHYP